MSLTDKVPNGNVQDVLKWAGNDQGRINAALEVENSKPLPRTSLINQLESRRASVDPAPEQAVADTVDEQAEMVDDESRRENTDTVDSSADTVQGAPGTDTQAAPMVAPDQPANQAARVRSMVVADGAQVRDADDVKRDEETVEHRDPSELVRPALTDEERDRVLDDVAARAVEDDHAPASPIQQGTGAVLDMSITPDEDSVTRRDEAEKITEEPCERCYPDGWATVGFEPGAALSCEHGRWVMGETPATRNDDNHGGGDEFVSRQRCPHCGRLLDEAADRAEQDAKVKNVE